MFIKTNIKRDKCIVIFDMLYTIKDKKCYKYIYKMSNKDTNIKKLKPCKKCKIDSQNTVIDFDIN